MYYYGKRGLQRDLNRAVQYYQMGADQGDPEGLYNLGVSMLKVGKNQHWSTKYNGKLPITRFHVSQITQRHVSGLKLHEEAKIELREYEFTGEL